MLQGLLPLDRSRVATEVLAGVTLAALAIPEVMGYTDIAGMPVITGLYTILLPVLLFALLGSSRHLVVGADSATAAILAAGLVGLAPQRSPEYVALAGMLALLAGGLLLLARLLRLGFLANFLSRTVLIGFLTGVGLQVACRQVAGMLGVHGGGASPLSQLGHAAQDLGSASADTVGVSVFVLLVIVVGPRVLGAVPWALVAVVGAIVASWVLDLAAHGVATLGPVPRGLPGIGFPDVASGAVPDLLATAASLFVVILAQSAATSNAFATRYGDHFDENLDLVGLGAANLGAGLTGAFVVNGSPTKTEVVDSAGGRTQLAQLTTAAVVLLVLVFLTGPLSYLPDAALAAIVFVIALRLVDVRGMRDVLHRRPFEFGVALITGAVVVLVGVRDGIALAIVLSVVIHLRHSYSPHDRLLVRTPDGDWTTRAVTAEGPVPEADPGLVLYRFNANLYYANAMFFQREVLSLARGPAPPAWLCLVADAMEDLDYSASETLRFVVGELRRRGTTLVLCGAGPGLRAELDRDHLTELIGADRLFPGVHEVRAAFHARSPVAPPPPAAAAPG